jgi:hypothetical protein
MHSGITMSGTFSIIFNVHYSFFLLLIENHTIWVILRFYFTPFIDAHFLKQIDK